MVPAGPRKATGVRFRPCLNVCVVLQNIQEAAVGAVLWCHIIIKNKTVNKLLTLRAWSLTGLTRHAFESVTGDLQSFLRWVVAWSGVNAFLKGVSTMS